MSEIGERELAAEEMIDRLMEAVELDDRERVVEIVKAHPFCDLPLVVIGLAFGLHRQEKLSEGMEAVLRGTKGINPAGLSRETAWQIATESERKKA